jgi:hypothetical protein
MEVRSQPHALVASSLGKHPLIPIQEKGGWTPELVWMFYRKEKFLAPASA